MFMTNRTPSSVKKHSKSTEPESHKTAKIGFFFFFLSSDRLAQYCVNLSQGFLQETTFYTEQFTIPSLFQSLTCTGHLSSIQEL